MECEKCCFDLDTIIEHSDFPSCHNVKEIKTWTQETREGISHEGLWEITCPICGTITKFQDGSL